MKFYTISAVLLIALLFLGCGTNTKIINSWSSTEVGSTEIDGKIAVLVKIDDHTLRRSFEDQLTILLKANGLDAISSYNHFTKNDLADENALMAKINELNVGAALTVFPISEKVKKSYAPTVSARVGAPVDFGLGPIFLGASVPIAGGSYSETIANLEVLYYIKDKNEAIYSSTISGSSDDTENMMKESSKLIINDLKKKLIIK